MQKITTFLSFESQAEEAMNLYTSVFKNSKITSVNRSGKNGPGPEGALFTGTFEIEGQSFSVLNGGPMFKFEMGISLFVNCETQEEVDLLWEKLSEGGEKSRCGWLKDRFGVWWQIIPTALGKLLYDKDAQKSARVMQAMMKMDKIIIKDLEAAYNQ
jgi:predicted 3-demethylubiquinone-9 3-methyltransferase (glyoxalase superfamily)